MNESTLHEESEYVIVILDSNEYRYMGLWHWEGNGVVFIKSIKHRRVSYSNSKITMNYQMNFGLHL